MMNAGETRVRKISGVLAGVAVMGVLHTAPVMAQGQIGGLIGDWSGSGRIHYTDGSSEGIRCTAYYSGGGSTLNMAIQCRSDKNPIHLRSKLRIEGSRASGEWEERTFNASGTASGSAGPGRLSLSVSGGGFTGSMSVSFSRSSHTVTITTQGIAMSRAVMNFSRN